MFEDDDEVPFYNQWWVWTLGLLVAFFLFLKPETPKPESPPTRNAGQRSVVGEGSWLDAFENRDKASGASGRAKRSRNLKAEIAAKRKQLHSGQHLIIVEKYVPDGDNDNENIVAMVEIVEDSRE